MFQRRKFIKQSLISGSSFLSSYMMANSLTEINSSKRIRHIKVRSDQKSKFNDTTIRFSIIGLNHGHIYLQTEALLKGGGKLVSVYAKEPSLVKSFIQRYPDTKVASSVEEILQDDSIDLIASASIPNQRAPLGIRVMKHGKDFMADKPGIISFDQLVEVKKVQKETKRIFSIMYTERLHNRATIKAGELVKSGAIGKVIQTIGLGPHRIRLSTRPEWFFDTVNYGGILADIGSHQADQFLYFTASTEADVVASQVGNLNNSDYPAFEDFGDMMVRGNNGIGYLRIDWFSPKGLNTWGDGRLIVLGTEGFIEVRKNIDLKGHDGGDHLFLINKDETIYFDCSEVYMPYGKQLVNDVVDRTETSMKQNHCFLATELALKGQAQAQKL